MISPQLRGRRHIVESRKYYLVRVIVFLWRVFFSLFLFLTGWEFGLIPYSMLSVTLTVNQIYVKMLVAYRIPSQEN